MIVARTLGYHSTLLRILLIVAGFDDVTLGYTSGYTLGTLGTPRTFISSVDRNMIQIIRCDVNKNEKSDSSSCRSIIVVR